MSKQKRGMFRRILDVGRKTLGLPVTRHYADPAFRDPRLRKKKRAYGHAQQGRWRGKELVRRLPPCAPGTITYHDKLVRHFGRRRAEGYRIAIQLCHLSCLPSARDFRNNPPWAFLND